MSKELLKENPELAIEVLAFAASRISHQLRTPLGTALGVIQDFREGVELGEEDWNDGLHALRKILDALDVLKEISKVEAIEIVDIDMREVIEEALEPFHDGVFEIGFTAPPLLDAIPVERSLVKRALMLLLQYFSDRSKQPEEKSDLEVCCFVEENELCLGFIFSPNSLVLTEPMRIAKTLGELAEIDRSMLSLKLLFVEAVIALHGGRSLLRSSKEGALELRLIFS